MKVKSIMKRDVAACHADDSMHEAARLMWDRDCGVVPVVERDGVTLEGVVTDRDLGMAALLSGRPIADLVVGDVMNREVCTCTEDDRLTDVHEIMRDAQIRRLPVIDEDGKLQGIVSLTDLVREAYSSSAKAAKARQRQVGKTLAAVSQPRELQ